MTDATNNETTKPKKRMREHARDWAGMAAFVTAVAAAVSGYTGRDSHDDKSKRMSRSVFNALNSQLTLLQYRLAVVEQACGVQVPPGFHGGFGMGATEPARRPAAASPRPPVAATAPSPEPEPEAMDDVAATAVMPEPEAPRKAPKLSFDAIQRVVEAGEVYEPEE